jgi:hypothetical protein
MLPNLLKIVQVYVRDINTHHLHRTLEGPEQSQRQAREKRTPTPGSPRQNATLTRGHIQIQARENLEPGFQCEEHILKRNDRLIRH